MLFKFNFSEAKPAFSAVYLDIKVHIFFTISHSSDIVGTKNC